MKFFIILDCNKLFNSFWMDRIFKLLIKFIFCKKKYLLSRSFIKVDNNASFIVEKGVRIINSKINIEPNCTVVIKKDTTIINCSLTLSGESTKVEIGSGNFLKNVTSFVKDGVLSLGDNNEIHSKKMHRNCELTIQGVVRIGNKNRLSCNIWTRYNSILSIGSYTNINDYSEIRCDEKVVIGNFNQISYNVMIWDTNTHCMYEPHERRELSKKYFLGYEYEKPKTAPIVIGDDCWIGKNASILKGVIISSNSIVGFGVLLTGKSIPENSVVVSDHSIRIMPK